MGCIEKNGVALYFEEMGEGLPLIFLHGLGGDINQPKGILTDLKDVRLIMLDQRAHGKSRFMQDAPMSFDDMADDVIELADLLKLNKFALGGISMGAGVAANTAYRYRDRIDKLILVRPAWGEGAMEAESREWYKELAFYLERQDRVAYEHSKTFHAICEKAPEAKASFLNAFENEASLTYYKKFEMIPSQCPYEKIENLKKIKADTIVLSNQHDRIHKYLYGILYMKYLQHGIFHEIVSKTVCEQSYKADIHAYISYYMHES